MAPDRAAAIGLAWRHLLLLFATERTPAPGYVPSLRLARQRGYVPAPDAVSLAWERVAHGLGQASRRASHPAA